MTPIRNTVRQELKIGRTVREITQYHGFTSRQVHNAIRGLDLTYHIDRVIVGNAVAYKINRRRAHPMRSGIKRH